MFPSFFSSTEKKVSWIGFGTFDKWLKVFFLQKKYPHFDSDTVFGFHIIRMIMVVTNNQCWHSRCPDDCRQYSHYWIACKSHTLLTEKYNNSICLNTPKIECPRLSSPSTDYHQLFSSVDKDRWESINLWNDPLIIFSSDGRRSEYQSVVWCCWLSLMNK